MKIGIIGGYGHHCVTPFPGAKLAFACDGYDERALVRAGALGCRQVYRTMEALLDGFHPDVVYIGTVYGRNGTLAARALEAGYDVVCEKPLAVDEATLKRLRELTLSGKRRIVAELTTRWLPAFEKAREIILSGTIGEPVMVQGRKSYKFGTNRPDFYRSRELFGGIIPWVATHAIDFAAWCTGLQYRSVTASHGNRAFPEYTEMEDHAAMLFQMSGGVPCVITADFLQPGGATNHSDDRLQVTGSRGVVEIRDGKLFVINANEEQSFTFSVDAAVNVLRAQELVAAALGETGTRISTQESLHVTAAALAARNAADDPHGGKRCIEQA